MTFLIFNFPSPSPLGTSFIKLIEGEEGHFLLKEFPDKETYLRLQSSPKGRHIIINASLFHPNIKIVNLIFLADTLRHQGGEQIGLLTPYLPYMRQDKVFQTGEALTSAIFAKLLSNHFDYLVTIDPHLHRYASLNEIYSIPTKVIHAAPLLSTWIQENVSNPFIIGPDQESAQWVKAVAGNHPFIVLNKIRHPEGHVDISWPKDVDIKNKTPILVDDIISSGGTMIQALHYLKQLGTNPPLCLAIHPLFAGNAYRDILKAGAEKVITCNTLPHPTNQIDVAPLLVEGLLNVT